MGQLGARNATEQLFVHATSVQFNAVAMGGMKLLRLVQDYTEDGTVGDTARRDDVEVDDVVKEWRRLAHANPSIVSSP